MVFLILILLGVFVFYVMKNGNHTSSTPKAEDPTHYRFYLKDENLLPKLDKFDVNGMDWWPSEVVGKANWYCEKVRFRDLEKMGGLKVGDKIWLDGYDGMVFPIPQSYHYAFDASDRDGQKINRFHLFGERELAKAFREKRLEAAVRVIDSEEKTVDFTLYALDKPLPWNNTVGSGYHIQQKSFDAQLEQAESPEELNQLLRDWWSKRDERAKKRAERKAAE